MMQPHATTPTALSRLVLATENQGKIAELRHLLGPTWTILGMDDIAATASEETGTTFEANAILKAEAVALQTKLPALADDSGLEVDALGGAPGVYSARYAGSHGDDAANRRKLLNSLTETPSGHRTCRLVCVVALAIPGAVTIVRRGTCEGTVGFHEVGTNGFGYDSLFALPDGRTMAQLEPGEKSRISHRAAAMHLMLPIIRQELRGERGSGGEAC